MVSVIKHTRLILSLCAASVSLAAQTSGQYSIQAAAGVQRQLGDGDPATAALLWSPRGVKVDGSGDIYIADTGDVRVREVLAAAGIITTVAGDGAAGFAGDSGPAIAAQVSFPVRAVRGPSGSVYVADSANHRVRMISAGGVITTVAGNGLAGYSGDGGAATLAQLNYPLDVAVDSLGNLYIADTDNNVIRRVTSDGRIFTIAGRGLAGFGGDQGPAVQALLSYPRGVAIDSLGVLYIADTLNNRIRKITLDGTIQTVAGRNGGGYSGDGGQAVQAALNQPAGVDVDAAGDIFIADTGNHVVRRVSAQGIILTIAGIGTPGFAGDAGAATGAQLNAPQGVSVDAAGNVFIADTENHRIRRVSGQTISTVAGSDPSGGDGGPAVAARLFQPSGVVFDPAGNLYIAETGSHRVRKVSPKGIISTVAGTGVAGYTGDGKAAAAAQLNGPNGLALDPAGNLYIADTGNNVVRKVNAGGVIGTIAGTGVLGNSGDGQPAVLAQLFNPNAVAVDAAGNIYVADSANHRVRKITADGIIRNFAGDGVTGLPGSSGDGGSATDALLNYPRSLAIDPSGNLYIADFFNHRIRKVAVGTNVITTYAGTGVLGGAGDGGPAAQAQFSLPAGIVLDKNHNLYVADSLNNRVRVVGSNGIVQWLAGSGIEGDSGDGGPAILAQLNSPRDVAVDSSGAIYFSDQDNHRVRKLSLSLTQVSGVTNAATGQPGPVAPGELITLFGAGLGPQAAAGAQVAGGFLENQLGDTQVLFDGVPAPLIYVSAGQINAIVPYEVAGHASTAIQVSAQGQLSSLFYATVAAAAPGIFSANSNGTGQAAAVNQDGTPNSASNPAARGSVISIYATGEGQTNPPGITGRIASEVLPQPVSAATVLIQGEAAEIDYSGAAPGTAGLLQINARIPNDVTPGSAVRLGLAIASFGSQAGITIAVK